MMGEWVNNKIKNLVTTSSGGTPSRSNPVFYNGEIPWVKTGELKNKYLYDTEEYITEEAIEKSSAKIFPPNTVLMAMYGATIGNSSILAKKASTNQACCAFLPSELIDYEFLFYKLSQEKNKLIALGAGGAQPNISQKIIQNFQIYYPANIKEQQKIAAILSSVDEAIEKTEEIIEQTENVKKGLMQQLLTKGIGHTKFKATHIGEIPYTWKVKKQGEIARFHNGRAYKQKEFTESGTPIVRIQNLTGGTNYVYSTLELDENKYIHKGDLIYAWSATFGPYIWEGVKSIYHYHIWKIDCSNEILKKYFYYKLHSLSNDSSSQKSGAVFAHLTKGFMESYEIAIPPLEEQEKIVDILESIDNKIEKENEKLNLLTNIKQGLMQQLLTGKIRVKIDEEVPT